MLKNEFSAIQNLFLIPSLTIYTYNNELNKTKQMVHHKRTEYKEELLQVKKRDITNKHTKKSELVLPLNEQLVLVNSITDSVVQAKNHLAICNVHGDALNGAGTNELASYQVTIHIGIIVAAGNEVFLEILQSDNTRSSETDGILIHIRDKAERIGLDISSINREHSSLFLLTRRRSTYMLINVAIHQIELFVCSLAFSKIVEAVLLVDSRKRVKHTSCCSGLKITYSGPKATMSKAGVTSHIAKHKVPPLITLE